MAKRSSSFMYPLRLQGQRPYLTVAAFVACDALAMMTAIFLAVTIRYALGGNYELSLYLKIWPVLPIFLLLNAMLGLYPGLLNNPADELKKLTWSTALASLVSGTLTFLSRDAQLYSRGAFILAIILGLIFAPGARALLRRTCAWRPWWGFPAVIFSSSDLGEKMVRTFRTRPELSLKPLAILSDGQEGDSVDGVPVVGRIEDYRRIVSPSTYTYAIVALPDMPPLDFRRLMEDLSQRFSRLIIIPQPTMSNSLWVTALDLGGLLALQSEQKLLDPRRLAIKRFMDLALIAIALPVIAVVLGSISLAILLLDGWPIFYRHARVGQGGERIHILKFRTMAPNADQLLAEHLAGDPELQREWAQDQKLKHDPRVTRIGRLLRKTSLDELPQLWNVLLGDLSLVGPRPIVDSEVPKYGSAFALYKRVKPGITGLWQVSGRNNVSYEERIELDRYYIANWSVWFDIHLLLRTIPVVLIRRGAY